MQILRVTTQQLHNINGLLCNHERSGKARPSCPGFRIDRTLQYRM